MDDRNRIIIEARSNSEWELWIPPSKPEHYAEDGADLGPYGITYFSSLGELLQFLAGPAHQDMIETGWTPKYLPPPDLSEQEDSDGQKSETPRA